MNMNSIRITLAAVFLSVSSSYAQVVLPDKGQEPGLRENVFGLGLWGGATTGLGLSFRHHLPSQLSYQVTGGIIKVDEKLSYDIGVEAQFDLVRSSSNRFFVGGGFGHYYSGKNGNDMNAPTRLGLGIGGEFAVTPGIHTTVELMFTYFSDGNVLPLPQIGFHYYFY
ncbi:MAG: hypothetical protein AAB393_08620 [Bacteroidota bacterium]